MKILKNSELLITSELEVYEAAEKWLRCDIKERKKFAKDLLLATRLPLLSKLTLKKLLKKSSIFTKLDDCNKVLKEILENKMKFYQNMTSTPATTRYCNQLMNVIRYDGILNKNGVQNHALENFNRIDVSNFEVSVFPATVKERYSYQVVRLKSDLYVLGGRSAEVNCCGKLEKSVARFSLLTKTWSEIAETPVRLGGGTLGGFCACAFVNDIFILGGQSDVGHDYDLGGTKDDCLQFDTKRCEFRKIARMVERRKLAACAVFEEKLVVAGGRDNTVRYLDTVECYDVTGSASWTRMPSMTQGKCLHSLMVVRNKLIAIGWGSNVNEVYTTNTGKFVALKSPALDFNRSVQVAGKIFVFLHNKAFVWVYDVEGEEWTKKESDAMKDVVRFSCATMPFY